MLQLTVATLRRALEGIPDDTPVYFRRVAPVCGNIEAAYSANLDKVAVFGFEDPCVILEPSRD